ncbi:MAG: hypothetical protein ACLFS0_10065, partial [Bacteroidales bacterium]
ILVHILQVGLNIEILLFSSLFIPWIDGIPNFLKCIGRKGFTINRPFYQGEFAVKVGIICVGTVLTQRIHCAAREEKRARFAAANIYGYFGIFV